MSVKRLRDFWKNLTENFREKINGKGGPVEERLYKKTLQYSKFEFFPPQNWELGFCFGFLEGRQLSSLLQNTVSADSQLLKNWEEQFFKR